MFEDELRDIYKEARAMSLEAFNKRAIGDIADEYIEDLDIKFEQKFSQY